VVIGLIVVYQWREGSRSAWPLALALGLLLGGAVGNFIDRVRLGGVIDFVDMGIGSWRFYTFNVADSAISTSLLLFILIGLFGERIAARLGDRRAT
jgi:signal peptidase II